MAGPSRSRAIGTALGLGLGSAASLGAALGSVLWLATAAAAQPHPPDHPGLDPAALDGDISADERFDAIVLLDVDAETEARPPSNTTADMAELAGSSVDPPRSGSPAVSETAAADAPDIEEVLDARQARFHAVAGGVLERLASAAGAGDAGPAHAIPLAGAIAVRARMEVLAELARRPEVRLILPDDEIRLIPTVAESEVPPGAGPSPGPVPLWNVERVRADMVWDRLGIDGSGVTIAVVDSGVDYHHPLLQTRYRGYTGLGPPINADNLWCRTGEDILCGFGTRYPADGLGHGTHVAGTAVAGDGVGVAPGARWIAMRTCPDTCRASWIADAFAWVLGMGPSVRPGVINASLTTTSEAGSAAIGPLIDDLVEAGVVMVAATGNGRGFPGLPAAHPRAIAVGATTPGDLMWENSQFGRTPSGAIKPELVAPGTAITSTIPGGGFAQLRGTSMASPHVAGIVALLLQAAPELTPAEVLDVLERTARPLAPVRPDPISGWGIVDAYAAVRSVSDIGTLRGRVTRAVDGEPIAWARVRVARLDGEPVISTDVEIDGTFEVDVAPGDYLVVVDAFAYRSHTTRGSDGTGIHIRDRETTVLPDIGLERETPTGFFGGTVTDAVTGAPLQARLKLEGVPFDIEANSLGDFSERLPPRVYTVRVEHFGYRVLETSIKIDPDKLLTADYALQPAPKILLVDGDAWAFTTAASAFRDSLRRLGYLAEEHHVTRERAAPGAPEGPPSVDTLSEYDLVIWSSAFSGPAFVRGAGPLSDYLAGGGRLLLSGQDALCIDAGIDNPREPCALNARPHPYVRERLHLRVVADNARSRTVIGAAGGPLEGITLTLNGPESMDNQSAPDVIEPTDSLHSGLIASYDTGGGAAALVGPCLDHRSIVLGFGFEGISGGADRDRVLERLLGALMAAPPAHDLHSRAPVSEQVARAGTEADFTVTLTSTGAETTTIGIGIESSRWLSGLWNADFTAPLEGGLDLPRCSGVDIGVRMRVPEDVDRGATNTVRLSFDSPDGAISDTLELVARALAPVLVVDGDYTADTEGRYLEAMDELDIPYDLWELGRLRIRPTLPPTDTLMLYPAVVWFTGYDPRPEGGIEQAGLERLAAYLDAGGRLLLASEDYMRARGERPYRDERFFHADYLGVDSHGEDGGRAHGGEIRGIAGSIFQGLDGCRLDYRPGADDYSDALRPGAGGRAALRDVFGTTIATQFAARAFKTLFLAFDAGSLDAECGRAVHARAADWFSPLHGSTLRLIDDAGRPLDRRAFAGGETIRLALTLAHTGPKESAQVRASWTLPEGVDFDPADLPPGWSLPAGTRTVGWRGQIARGEVEEVVLPLRLAEDLPPGTALASRAEILGDGLPVIREAGWRVDAADLSRSLKSAADGADGLEVGQDVTFSLIVRNDGVRDAAFTLTDTLPSGLALVDGSWRLSDPLGRVDADLPGGRLTWEGDVPADRVTTLQYRARVVTRSGGMLENRAVLADDGGEVWRLSASVFARPRLYFPWNGREFDEDP